VESLEDAVRDPIDAVVHCAARIPGPGSSDDLCAADNRRIDDRVLAFCQARRVPVVFFSTAAVYPHRSDGARVDETSPVGPTDRYAAAKLESERRFLELGAAPAAIFRITSPYGPRQRNESVIRRFCRAALEGRPIEVWGSGRREQDFIHLGDNAGAVGAALAAPAFPAGVHLVASGRPTTTLELATTILEAAGNGSGVSAGARPDPEDGRTARYSIDRIQATTGWAPRITLTEGLAACLRAWRGAT
jgi:nucleoside-diphosphate-sugar epimerase